METRKEEIRKLKEEVARKPPDASGTDAYVQELKEIGRKAVEESEKHKLEAEEQTARAQDERTSQQLLRREVEMLKARMANENGAAEMNAEMEK